MSEIRSHRDLRAWQLSYAMALRICRLANAFPSVERFGLALQLRRSAVSVPSNIAEGYGRGTTQDYARFLRIARGSLFEADTQLQCARDLGYIDDETWTSLAQEWSDVSRVLAGLIRSIEQRSD